MFIISPHTLPLPLWVTYTEGTAQGMFRTAALSILSYRSCLPLASNVSPALFCLPSPPLPQLLFLLIPSFSLTHSTLTFPLTHSFHFFSPTSFFHLMPDFPHTFTPLNLFSQIISLYPIYNHVLLSPTLTLLTSSLHQLHRYAPSHRRPTPASFLCANLLYPVLVIYHHLPLFAIVRYLNSHSHFLRCCSFLFDFPDLLEVRLSQFLTFRCHLVSVYCNIIVIEKM